MPVFIAHIFPILPLNVKNEKKTNLSIEKIASKGKIFCNAAEKYLLHKARNVHIML